MEELNETQQYAAKKMSGERRHSQAAFEGADRRKPKVDEEERLRQEEELRLQDQLDRPETD